jgi:hypothetical protein
MNSRDPGTKMANAEDSREMAEALSKLLRQREVLRQQSTLIDEALARVTDEIELLRAQAKGAGVHLGDQPE